MYSPCQELMGLGPPLSPRVPSSSPQAVQALEQFATVVEAKLIKYKKEIVSE